MANLIGVKLAGRYEITRLLGEGGMAEVYQAHQPVLNRQVAVKLMHRHLSSDDQFKARFEREAQAIASLKHPHIIQLYDFDLDPDLRQYFMVIEYIEGPTLSEYLKQHNSILPLTQTLRIIEDLTDALGYAHAHQMQHRDIKPSNIMLDKGLRTVLTDFGIAKLVQDAGQQLTASGAMVGTPAYISPEQASGIQGDHRSDIYSLGVVFYQLATGRLPYQGDTPIATILKHIKEIPQPPTMVNPNLPVGVESVILRCLAKDPEDRYQNMQDLLTHLRDLEAAAAEVDNVRTISGKILGDEIFTTPSGVRTTDFAATHMTDTIAIAPRRTSLLIGAGAIAIIALLTLGAFLFSTAGEGAPAPNVTACILTLNDPLNVFAEPSETNPTEIVSLAAQVEFEVMVQTDGFFQIEWSDGTGWVPEDALTLPPDCRPMSATP